MQIRSIKPVTAFWAIMLAALLIKLVIAAVVPVIGDEAYFIQWGQGFALSYYDHPPMVGWWLASLLTVDDATLWLRLPSVLTTSLIGWMIYRLTRTYSLELAVLAGGLYLLAPVNLIPLITTDTPLLLFSFLSGVAFYKAQPRDHLGWYLLSGLLLGLAFYSKFFAGLLGIAYVLYVLLFVRRGWRPYGGLLLVIVGTLPFIGLNLYWNYFNCWNNYLFNLQNRTVDFVLSLSVFGSYLLILLYLITPPILFYIARRWRGLGTHIRGDRLGVFLALFLLPVVLFLLLATGKRIGLHWLLSFYPFLFPGIIGLLSFRQLRASFAFMAAFGLVHVIALALFLVLWPVWIDRDSGTYKDLVYGFHAEAILARIEPYVDDYTLATPSYTGSAVLSYYRDKHVIVLGPGSYHARHDDLVTDFRDLDGKPIAVLSHHADVKDYARFFESFTHYVIEVHGARYHLGVGLGFDYARYRKDVLLPVIKRYYRIPPWLPAAECYMHRRYLPAPGEGNK